MKSDHIRVDIVALKEVFLLAVACEVAHNVVCELIPYPCGFAHNIPRELMSSQLYGACHQSAESRPVRHPRLAGQAWYCYRPAYGMAP